MTSGAFVWTGSYQSRSPMTVFRLIIKDWGALISIKSASTGRSVHSPLWNFSKIRFSSWSVVRPSPPYFRPCQLMKKVAEKAYNRPNHCDAASGRYGAGKDQSDQCHYGKSGHLPGYCFHREALCSVHVLPFLFGCRNSLLRYEQAGHFVFLLHTFHFVVFSLYTIFLWPNVIAQKFFVLDW